MSRPVRWLIGMLLLVTSPTAHAHMLNTGLGPFYDGLAHLFVSPEDRFQIAIALSAGFAAQFWPDFCSCCRWPGWRAASLVDSRLCL
jgi:hypothetical protein